MLRQSLRMSVCIFDRFLLLRMDGYAGRRQADIDIVRCAIRNRRIERKPASRFAHFQAMLQNFVFGSNPVLEIAAILVPFALIDIVSSLRDALSKPVVKRRVLIFT